MAERTPRDLYAFGGRLEGDAETYELLTSAAKLVPRMLDAG